METDRRDMGYPLKQLSVTSALWLHQQSYTPDVLPLHRLQQMKAPSVSVSGFSHAGKIAVSGQAHSARRVARGQNFTIV